MELLCLSNGHGEDAIAMRICLQLQQHLTPPNIVALPIVGEGRAYIDQGIPLIASTQKMPSGGFIYMDWQQLKRDIEGGLLQQLWQQFQSVKLFARQGGAILAVGDIVPLLFAWLSGAPYVFVGTAKSEYYLRDEGGKLWRKSRRDRWENWSGSVYLPWERWLMSHRRCKAVFPRDSFTAKTLQKFAIPIFDLGNPMMDDLQPVTIESIFPVWDEECEPDRSLSICLLPGSRVPEAYENWQLILLAVAGVMDAFRDRSVRFLAAISPELSLAPLGQILESLGWRQNKSEMLPSGKLIQDPAALVFAKGTYYLILSHKFNDCLHAANFAISMAGTATEQFVGLGKPAIAISGKGPQFTHAFAEAQSRLLGPSLILVDQPTQVAFALKSLLHDPDRLQIIVENGPRRMGKPGASRRIAKCLMERLQKI